MRLWLMLAWALGACGGGDDGGGGPDGDADGDSDTDTDTDSDADTDTDGDSDTDADLDEEACRHVDLVIAVDDSSSMREEKDALRGTVFPAFARELLSIGGGLEDFRVGVLDACPDPADYHTRGAGGDCAFASGQIWMESTDPDLEGEFACVGDIDSSDSNCSGSNDDEQPLSAAASSLEEPWSAGANAGFRREEALLVVVAITDEDEQPTGDAESADELFDRFVAITGDAQRMVVLGIGGGSNCDGVYGEADEATLLRSTVDRFTAVERGVFWDLCDGQLEDGLAQAMAVIDEACTDLPDIF